MQPTGATLIGGAELKAKFKDMEEAMNRPEFIDSCEKAAEVIRREALANAQRLFRRGRGILFRNFVTRRLEPTKTRTGGAVAAVWKRPMIKGNRASYAQMLEYGTVHMSPQPFFRLAVDHNHARCARLMRRGAEKAIEAEARKKILFRTF